VIDRPTSIGALASGLFASPSASLALLPTRVPGIGVIGSEDTPPSKRIRRGLFGLLRAGR
jgi:hypothetical protein